MDRINSRIATIYGYAVCLICVIVILVSTHSVIDAAFDYANPIGADVVYGRFGPMSTFESYRIRAREAAPKSPDGSVSPGAQLSDAQLRAQYDEEKAQQQSGARFRALRSLVSGIVFLVLATAMFLLHWRWIRRTNTEPPVG
jgi:hypothetical protein